MIKVNLAKPKHFVGGFKDTSTMIDGTNLFERLKFEAPGKLKDVQDLIFSQLTMIILIAAAAWYYAGDYRDTKIQEANEEYDSFVQKKELLNADLLQLSNFENLRRNLEANQKVIDSKMERILRLINTRYETFKLLNLITSSLPPKSWIAMLRANKSNVNLEGSADSLTTLSDMMKNLQNIELFERDDVKLLKSSEGTLAGGQKVVNFSVDAKKKGF
jgi:Tfp pilus assembly protein PilN